MDNTTLLIIVLLILILFGGGLLWPWALVVDNYCARVDRGRSLRRAPFSQGLTKSRRLLEELFVLTRPVVRGEAEL
jgi:hypothetical protein